MHIFCTVGTTEFDVLLSTILIPKFINRLFSLGYVSMTVQKGQGIFLPDYEAIRQSNPKFHLELYGKKPSLEQDMKNADLIISHGGSGCIFETPGPSVGQGD